MKTIKHVNTVVIGGGQAGLAMSRCLVQHGIDHVVLERGRIGERWRSERWDSLRLLSPNWHSRLPHWTYSGDGPDGFMTMPEFIRHLEAYARSFEAPVVTGTTVRAAERLNDGRFSVATGHDVWLCANLVIASGFCDMPRVPDFAADIPQDIAQIVPSDYRNPGQVAEGGVLIVGSSATGLQIGEELLAADHPVTVSVGTHVRWPRRYRGRDILYWIDQMGAFAVSADPAIERTMPPPQLVGSPDNHDLDLVGMQDRGAKLTGHAIGIDGRTIRFADDLRQSVVTADAAMFQLLDKIDGYIEANGVDAPATDRTMIRPVSVDKAPATLDLDAERIRTIVWATGYQRQYPWLRVPVLNAQGEINHKGGVTAVDGLYVIGMRFQRRKDSNLIDGVGRDAEDLSAHLAARMRDRAA